jgi:hypothetical protein
MMDMFYIGVGLALFGATYGLLSLCEKLSHHDTGGRP